jgi:hypothetical protein
MTQILKPGTNMNNASLASTIGQSVTGEMVTARSASREALGSQRLYPGDWFSLIGTRKGRGELLSA